MSVSITLIVPVFNVEKYLEQCLESVVEQIVPFDKVILVNDGSTDNSLQICKRYVSDYKKIELINQENKGLSAARNIGMLYAQSEYVMFLDSDDYLELNVVEKLKNKLEKNKYDAVFFDSNIFCEKRCEIKKNIYDRSKAGLDKLKMTGLEYFYKCYPQNYIVSACMGVYKRQVLNKEGIKFPEGLLFEDNYFSFVILNRAKKVTHISEKLYHRRYRKNSITTSKYSARKLRDHIKIGLLIWNEIKQIDERILFHQREVFLRFINDYFSMVLKNCQRCLEEKILLNEEAEGFLENMTSQYLILLTRLKVCDSKDVSLLDCVLRSLDKIFLWNIGNVKEGKKIAETIIKIQKDLYVDLLSGLPLDDKNSKVAIYGMGKHTEGLLAIYERLIGKVTCDLIFLDSYKDNGEYKDKKIVNYRGIDKTIRLIIISSFLYEKEMLENVRSIDSTVSIYTFYDSLKEDAFSKYETFLKYC